MGLLSRVKHGAFFARTELLQSGHSRARGNNDCRGFTASVKVAESGGRLKIYIAAEDGLRLAALLRPFLRHQSSANGLGCCLFSFLFSWLRMV